METPKSINSPNDDHHTFNTCQFGIEQIACVYQIPVHLVACKHSSYAMHKETLDRVSRLFKGATDGDA